MKVVTLRALFRVLIVLLLSAAVPVAAQEKVPAGQDLMEMHPAPAKTQKTIGVLVFPGFEMLDAYGPMELWGNLQHVPARLWESEEKRVGVRVVTIAARRGEVPSGQGPKTVADFGFEDAPHLDYLLVPGGLGVFPVLKDPATLAWLRSVAGKADLVMSVCNGASLLAAAGVLDGRPATTNKMIWKLATAPGPKVKWVKRARWVDDGRIVTSSGISAGIDMTLAVMSRLYGSKVAEFLETVTEYDAHKDASWDPFAAKAGLVD